MYVQTYMATQLMTYQYVYSDLYGKTINVLSYFNFYVSKTTVYMWLPMFVAYCHMSDVFKRQFKGRS